MSQINIHVLLWHEKRRTERKKKVELVALLVDKVTSEDNNTTE